MGGASLGAPAGNTLLQGWVMMISRPDYGAAILGASFTWNS
jgi:hypothetical protein